MNKSYSNNRNRNRNNHTGNFSSVHPPGGLVAWPDGSTSRIGERRPRHAFVKGKYRERKGFVGWPIGQAQAVRA